MLHASVINSFLLLNSKHSMIWPYHSLFNCLIIHLLKGIRVVSGFGVLQVKLL